MALGIILLDSDQAIAVMFEEGVEAARDQGVRMVDGGDEALELITGDCFDMAIVDMGPEHINPHAMVRDIRRASRSIHITLMPLTGEEVLAELKGVEIYGVLPRSSSWTTFVLLGAGNGPGWRDHPHGSSCIARATCCGATGQGIGVRGDIGGLLGDCTG